MKKDTTYGFFLFLMRLYLMTAIPCDINTQSGKRMIQGCAFVGSGVFAIFVACIVDHQKNNYAGLLQEQTKTS